MSFKQLVQVPKILVGHFQSNYWISFNRHLENQLVGEAMKILKSPFYGKLIIVEPHLCPFSFFLRKLKWYFRLKKMTLLIWFQKIRQITLSYGVSYAATNDLTWRMLVRTTDIEMADHLCVCDYVGSVHRYEQISSHSLSTGKHKAFLPCVSFGELSNG